MREGQRREAASLSSDARTASFVSDERQTAVWVDLDQLYPIAPVDGEVPADDDARAGGPGAPQPGGLVVHGEASGLLHRWERATDGRWLAVVSFLVPYRHGVTPGFYIRRALLPRAAVRPREGEGRGPAADLRR